MHDLTNAYRTIQQSVTAMYKDRGSRFLGVIFPVSSAEAFKKQLAQLRKEHSKAVHHCYAYRINPELPVSRSSDDGEPSGTAGKPILNQLESHQLLNVGVVVVRYFGGTLLGTGGLIQAYRTATSLAIQSVPIIQRDRVVKYSLEFDYHLLNEVMGLLKSCDCSIEQQEIGLFCRMQVLVPNRMKPTWLFRIGELGQGITFQAC